MPHHKRSAEEAGIAALRWIIEGYGYEISRADVLAAYSHTMKAAEHLGIAENTQDRIRKLISIESPGEDFVTQTLVRYSDLDT